MQCCASLELSYYHGYHNEYNVSTKIIFVYCLENLIFPLRKGIYIFSMLNRGARSAVVGL